MPSEVVSGQDVTSYISLPNGVSSKGDICSVWFPEAPKGYVAMGCVVSSGRTPPPLSSAFCILGSLVAPCSPRDCVTISFSDGYVLRVDYVKSFSYSTFECFV